MEDHFDKLIYLVVGIIYFILNNSKSHSTDDKTVINEPSERQPVPTISSTKWPNTWKNAVQKAPGVRKTLSQTVMKKMSPHAIQRATPQLATQQPSSKKVDRVLDRYSSWKKAIIMAELLQPRS